MKNIKWSAMIQIAVFIVTLLAVSRWTFDDDVKTTSLAVMFIALMAVLCTAYLQEALYRAHRRWFSKAGIDDKPPGMSANGTERKPLPRRGLAP